MKRNYLRNKVGSRLAGLRERARSYGNTSAGAEQFQGSRSYDGGSDFSSYSALQSQQSSDGFLLVDDEFVEDLGDDDAAVNAHLSLEQQQQERQLQETEDPVSDDGELEGLDIPDEEEEPKPKPASSSGGAGINGSCYVKKPWDEASKDVYEGQMALLNEQLMAAMMENQSLQCKTGINAFVVFTHELQKGTKCRVLQMLSAIVNIDQLKWLYPNIRFELFRL